MLSRMVTGICGHPKLLMLCRPSHLWQLICFDGCQETVYRGFLSTVGLLVFSIRLFVFEVELLISSLWSLFFELCTCWTSVMAMPNPPFRNCTLVQQCITDYFPFRSSRLVQQYITTYFPLCASSLATMSCEFDSLVTSTDGYVSETPTSKQGDIAYYLGLRSNRHMCATTAVRSTEALFERAVAIEASSFSSASVNQDMWRFVYAIPTRFISLKFQFTYCTVYYLTML